MPSADSPAQSSSDEAAGALAPRRSKRKEPAAGHQLLPMVLANSAGGRKLGAKAAAGAGHGSVRAAAKISEGTPLKLSTVRKTPYDFGDGTERGVPTFLLDAFVHIQRNGLDVEGIFRREGNAKRVRAVWGPLHGYVGIPELCNVHDVCCMVKRFLRDIREPLLTRSLQRQFILSVQTIKHEATRVRCIMDLCQVLPQAHKDTLGFIMRQLKLIATHSSENKMGAHALATVLAPTVFRGDDAAPPAHGKAAVTQNQVAAQAFMKSTGELLRAKIGVIELLIMHADEIAVLSAEEKIMSPSGFDGICPGEAGNNFGKQPVNRPRLR